MSSEYRKLLKPCGVCHLLSTILTALKQLHGADKYHGEKADIEKERVDALGVRPKKPWELFLDKSLRWQLITIIVLNIFQQLNGINAVWLKLILLKNFNKDKDVVAYFTSLNIGLIAINLILMVNTMSQ